jgi:hypothetical protein
MRELTPLFEHRLFLSASPHNGHSNSFSALLAMLDPQRFIRGEQIKDPRLLDQVMVRRLKDELRDLVPDLGLPKREVKQHDISGLPEDAPDLALMRLLSEYRSLRERRPSRFVFRRHRASRGKARSPVRGRGRARPLAEGDLFADVSRAAGRGAESLPRQRRPEQPAESGRSLYDAHRVLQ